MLTKANVACAEIPWASITVESKIFASFLRRYNAHFREMFPNSKIAHNFSLSRMKCNYLCFELWFNSFL